MIPRANITAWRRQAPWPDDAEVEQDLVLSRALIELFNQPTVAEQAVVRGGTALHKLYFEPPARYSEDIDLVQRASGPIGSLITGIREALDQWLGSPKWKQGKGRFTLYYRLQTSFEPVVRARVKVEINTREHFHVLGLVERDLRVDNPWFTGSAKLVTYHLAELLGTKLRALYQRKKGRDLFDLWLGLTEEQVAPEETVASFIAYMRFLDTPVSRAQFEANMARKLADPAFLGDLNPLLRPAIEYDAEVAWSRVHRSLVSRLPDAPWKATIAGSQGTL